MNAAKETLRIRDSRQQVQTFTIIPWKTLKRKASPCGAYLSLDAQAVQAAHRYRRRYGETPYPIYYLIFVFELRRTGLSLAVDGVLCEPLSERNSLLTAKNTGKIAN